MGCLKLSYQPQERVLERTSLFLEKGLEKNGSGSKNRVRRYRYGFNGMEKDDEWKGTGNSYTTEFRQLDPRLGRWLSTDPVVHPGMSPYNSFDNNPIRFVDPFGSNAWEPEVDSDGNLNYVAEEGDLANPVGSLVEQYDLTQSEAEKLLQNNLMSNSISVEGEGSSLQVGDKITGAGVLRMNLSKTDYGGGIFGIGNTKAFSPETQQRAIDQFTAVIFYSRNNGIQQIDLNNVFNVNLGEMYYMQGGGTGVFNGTMNINDQNVDLTLRMSFRYQERNLIGTTATKYYRDSSTRTEQLRYSFGNITKAWLTTPVSKSSDDFLKTFYK
jgi:RHS repeat-associated protein